MITREAWYREAEGLSPGFLRYPLQYKGELLSLARRGRGKMLLQLKEPQVLILLRGVSAAEAGTLADAVGWDLTWGQGDPLEALKSDHRVARLYKGEILWSLEDPVPAWGAFARWCAWGVRDQWGEPMPEALAVWLQYGRGSDHIAAWNAAWYVVRGATGGGAYRSATEENARVAAFWAAWDNAGYKTAKGVAGRAAEAGQSRESQRAHLEHIYVEAQDGKKEWVWE